MHSSGPAREYYQLITDIRRPKYEWHEWHFSFAFSPPPLSLFPVLKGPTLVRARCYGWLCLVFFSGLYLSQVLISVFDTVTYPGFAWLIITGSGFGWLDVLALLLQFQSILTSHNQWLSETCSIPYWTTSVFPSTVTDLVLIYESVTSSASVFRWLTLNYFYEWISEVANEFFFNNSGRTVERPPPRTVRQLLSVSSVATKRASSEPLSSNGPFRHSTLADCYQSLHFDTEDESSNFFREVDKFLPDYTAFISQKILLFIATAVRTSNPVICFC
jgi:hypothetical protein